MIFYSSGCQQPAEPETSYMQGLTEKTWKIVAVLFPGDTEEVAGLLATDCGTNLPFCENYTKEDLERVRFAVLKISSGEINKLLDAIALAKIDWRDVLVAAGFANSLAAHQEWASQLLP